MIMILLYKIVCNKDKYKYSGCGIGFDSKGSFLHSNGLGRNAFSFGADMSSSTHTNNKTRNILVLGRDFIQGIDGTAIYAENTYSINFSETGARSFFNLHFNGANSYLLVNGTEIHKFKAKDSEIVEDSLCLRNISKDFFESSMKKQDCMDLFIISVLIIMLLQQMIY